MELDFSGDALNHQFVNVAALLAEGANECVIAKAANAAGETLRIAEEASQGFVRERQLRATPRHMMLYVFGQFA